MKGFFEKTVRATSWRRAMWTMFAAAGACAGVSSVHATEGGNSAYVIGAQTFREGSVPEDFQLQTFSVFYDSSHFKNSTGGDRFSQFSTTVGVQAFRLSYGLPQEYTPGFYIGFAVLEPIFSIDTLRKPPGAAPLVHGRDEGGSDPLVTPLIIGNEFDVPLFGHIKEALKLTVNVPVGEYDKTQPINVGHHYWSYLPSYGIEAHPDDKTYVGVNVTWLINETNHATDYRSGQETVTEFSAMRKVSTNLSLGVNGYYYRQITADKQNGVIFQDGFYGRATAIGPQLEYVAPFGGVTVKWQHEMDVQNRPEGNRFWLQLAFKF
jgi:hypothetical protein